MVYCLLSLLAKKNNICTYPAHGYAMKLTFNGWEHNFKMPMSLRQVFMEEDRGEISKRPEGCDSN